MSVIILGIGVVGAELDIGLNQPSTTTPKVVLTIPTTTTIDNSTFYSNNSQYLQGLTPQQVANLYKENDTLQSVTSRGNRTTENIELYSANPKITLNSQDLLNNWAYIQLDKSQGAIFFVTGLTSWIYTLGNSPAGRFVISKVANNIVAMTGGYDSNSGKGNSFILSGGSTSAGYPGGNVIFRGGNTNGGGIPGNIVFQSPDGSLNYSYFNSTNNNSFFNTNVTIGGLAGGNNVQLIIGNCSSTSSGTCSNYPLEIVKRNGCIRVNGLNSNNYMDTCASTDAGIGYIGTGYNTFAFYVGGTSNLGLKYINNGGVMYVSGAYSSASGSGNNVVFSGGQEGVAGNQYFGGYLYFKAGSSTNVSRLGEFRIIDAKDGALNDFIRADSINDRLNFTSISNFVNTTTYWDNIKSFFGDSNDASIYYNTTDLVINPKEVGTGKVDIAGDIVIEGNLKVLGNVSLKRAYWSGYYNGTDNFLSTAAVQKMNLSNNPDFDSYGININATQAITFDMTGDYLCIISPEFTNTAATAQVAFWMRKNGVDVPWSNSRYSISNGEYLAPAIPFQFDIDNTTTDYIEFYWYSTSTNSKLESISGLTAPTRPSVPAVIVNCQKVSELTP